jgi:hypothetical protein
MEDSGIYDEPGTGGQQPTTESSAPDGGGVFSRTAEGANKVDPVSAGPNLGNTIAGRTAESGTVGGLDGLGSGRADAGSRRDEPTGQTNQTGGTDTDGQGVAGHTGREPGEGHGGSKGAATENINPGESGTD